VKNAGVENAGAERRGGKCGSGKCRRIARVEIAGVGPENKVRQR